ncbi:hypothetical protein D3C71_1727140 [compost metagenome]
MPSECHVTPGLAERNIGQRLPHPQLERRAVWGKREIEAHALTAQVLQQLSACVAQCMGVALPVFAPFGVVTVVLEQDVVDALAVTGHGERADRAVEGVVEQGHEVTPEDGVARCHRCRTA